MASIETEASRSTVVMVPGLDGTALMFYRQVPLLERRFKVITRPHLDDPSFTMDDLVENLRELIEEEAEGPVYLCGESFGGALSLSFAVKYPHLLSGLIIVNSFSVMAQRWRLWLVPPVMRVMPWDVMAVMRKFTESRLHSPHCLEEDLQEFHQRSLKIGRIGYIRRLEVLRHYDMRPELSGIQLPTLFLAGDQDHLIPSVKEARYMSQRMPNAKMQILTGYGHICLINHDLDLLEYIGPWVDAQEGAAS